MQAELRETVTVREAAKRLGIANSTAYAAASDGSLPTIRVGGRVLVPARVLDKMLGIEGDALIDPLQAA